MRPELARARRNRAVRDAALGWMRSGIIDEPAVAAIAARYPDDRISRSGVWRVLVFLFVSVIASAAMGVAFAILRPGDHAAAMLAILFGGALAVATEVEQGAFRFDGTGAEGATSWLAATSIIVGAVILFDQGPAEVRLVRGLLLSAAIWGAASWRWGFPIYALFSAVSLFFALSALGSAPRASWIAAAAAVPWVSSAARRRRLAPPHRTAWEIVTGTALAALYASLNLYSYDHGWIEALRPGSRPSIPAFPGARFLAAAATAILPVLLLLLGLSRRRRLLVDLGLAFVALSLVTLRAYVHLGPLWAVLCASGAALVLIAAATERVLARERAGWTAESLSGHEERDLAATAVGTVVALSPDARRVPATAEFKPGGGSYGGGGASGEF